jgi:hypothetical protein
MIRFTTCSFLIPTGPNNDLDSYLWLIGLPRQAIKQAILKLKGPDIELRERIGSYIAVPWWHDSKYYIKGTGDAA